jgi:acetoin utilization deacetylase AcuC-like enzyme
VADLQDAEGAVPVVWSPETRLHDPRHEVWLGTSTPATEVAARVDTIRDALVDAGHPLQPADAYDDLPLLGVHDEELVGFLRTAADRWEQGGYADLVGQDRVVPYFFPTPALTAGMPVRRPAALHGLTGRFCYDTMTLVGPGTWEAARAAVDCALTAVRLVVEGAAAAYALCRPPGHHVTRTGYGGSCYLNNAAVAAQALRDAGHPRVAVLDIDAHHGNGTAAIFYDRRDVCYGSVHVDPAAGWFPHVVGHAEETGSGPGAGATRNLPLPEGAGDGPWTEAVAALADWVRAQDSTALVVSLGVDAAADDPESPLLVTAAGYERAGRLLGGLGLPAVVVQEGGYHLPTLGELVATYLAGHRAGAAEAGHRPAGY